MNKINIVFGCKFFDEKIYVIYMERVCGKLCEWWLKINMLSLRRIVYIFCVDDIMILEVDFGVNIKEVVGEYEFLL